MDELTINENKSKIVHIRPPSFQRSDFAFTCGNKALDTDASYKYLWLWLNEFLDMKFSVRETTKSASRALGALYTKCMYGGGMTHEVYTKLIEAVVEPVLFYGACIWGLNNYPEVSVVLNKACRYFLGTGANTSNLATRGDMGWHSCHIKHKLECIRLWCRLSNTPRDRIVRRIHDWSLAQGKSWEKRMVDINYTVRYGRNCADS